MTFEELVMRFDPDAQVQSVALFPTAWAENAALTAVAANSPAVMAVALPGATGGLVQTGATVPTNDTGAVACTRQQTLVRVPQGHKVYLHAIGAAAQRGGIRMWKLPT